MDALLIILVGITAVAALLWWINRSMMQLRAHDLQLAQREVQSQAQRESVRTGLRVLASSIIDDQVNQTEACIRIKVLLENYDRALLEHEDFQVFTEVYEATRHMPTHEAREQTDTRFLRKLDRQRHQLEFSTRPRVLSAARALLRREELVKSA